MAGRGRPKKSEQAVDPQAVDPVVIKNPIKVIQVYKDLSGGDDVWVQAFGINEIEVDQDVLHKYGKVTSKTIPEVFPLMLDQLDQKVKEILGL